MNIKQLLIIPDRNDLDRSLGLAREYGCGFEYNDFFMPEVLRSKERVKELVELYNQFPLPEYCTLHGAFLDVTVFSDDPDIRRVSDERVNQSLQAARMIGARGVVFHTNYIPNFLTESYRNSWVEKNSQYWAEKLEQYPEMDIYIENMFDTDEELIARLGAKMKEYAHFGLCLDYAHAQVFGDETRIDRWVASLAPYVKHMHINDNDFRSDLHLPIGEGKTDWNNFKTNYERWLSNSPVLVEHTGYERIKRSLDRLAEL